MSELRSYKIPRGNWFRFDLMPRFPLGLLPMGEALTSFNPMYGQGISLSAGQALALRAALANSIDDSLASEYFSRCQQLNGVGWTVMETRDLAYPTTGGARPADLEERWRIGSAIRRLAEQDPAVHALTVRVVHLLDPPDVLARPDILERARALAG